MIDKKDATDAAADDGGGTEEWDMGLSDEEAEEFDSILDEIDVEKLAREADEEEEAAARAEEDRPT